MTRVGIFCIMFISIHNPAPMNWFDPVRSRSVGIPWPWNPSPLFPVMYVFIYLSYVSPKKKKMQVDK